MPAAFVGGLPRPKNRSPGRAAPETRKPRGSLGRSLNPLGTLAQSVSGRGPNSDRSLASDRSLWRGAIRRSLTVRRPPLLVSEKFFASPKARRSDYRSTIPKDPRPIFRPSPAPSVSRWLQVTRTQVPMRLSPRRALHPGPPPGFPCGVPGKVDRALNGGNLWTCLFFATDDRVFASRPRGSASTISRSTFPPGAAPREKPRESLGRSLSPLGALICHETRKAGPRSGGDPERSKPLLPRPGLPRVGHRKL
jgi:hypothetical protein